MAYEIVVRGDVVTLTFREPADGGLLTVYTRMDRIPIFDTHPGHGTADENPDAWLFEPGAITTPTPTFEQNRMQAGVYPANWNDATLHGMTWHRDILGGD